MKLSPMRLSEMVKAVSVDSMFSSTDSQQEDAGAKCNSLGSRFCGVNID